MEVPTVIATNWWRRWTSIQCVAAICTAFSIAGGGLAAGTLTPVGALEAPVQIREHHVSVVLDNGFARTEVTQTFFNPNAKDLEAIYAFPVPKSGCLSEVTIYIGEKAINGEVLPKREAEQIHEEEKAKGNDTGLAKKNDFQTYEFRVSPVRANAETRLRFVYYQPLVIDTGVGRYVYPLETGGTDEQASQFWLSNEKVEGEFTADVELRSAVPVTDVRAPGFESALKVEQIDAGHYKLNVTARGAMLNRDFVFYYKLAENLPGRVDLVAYRADPSKPGTFMLVVTPGVDLQPLNHGADYAFVLDTSGSMTGKLATLANGVKKALGEMRAEDRFRVITFNTNAAELTSGWTPATPANVDHALAQVAKLTASGSTNIYDGLAMALNSLSDDRATSVILVTDGVVNTGVVDPPAFQKLLARNDIRFFGFLMGNSSNWPLMQLMAQSSGGFYAAVSNNDDIVGQILLAKSKITNECMHDVKLSINGVRTSDCTDGVFGKVYRGQQLVIFGRYDGGGEATIELNCRMTGEDKTYRTTFRFPDEALECPEIERMWAMDRVEAIQQQKMVGALPVKEAEQAIESLGVTYQIVTDETSMVVLSDDAFAQRGIERRNQQRTAAEQAAQAQRNAQPVRSNRADEAQPMFSGNAPTPTGNGAGAIDPVGVALAAIIAVGLLAMKAGKSRM